MARAFVASSSQRLEASATPVSGATSMTLSTWVRMTNVAGGSFGPFIAGDTAYNGSFFFHVDDDPLSFSQDISGYVGGVNAQANAALLVQDVWSHVAMVFVGGTSITLYHNGSQVGQTTSSIPASVPSHTGLRLGGSADAGFYLNARLADPAIWDAALSAVEITALARGVAAGRVRPLSLKAQWPLYGVFSAEPDAHPSGGTRYPLTLVNAPAQANHAPVEVFSRRFWATIPSFAAAGGTDVTVTPGQLTATLSLQAPTVSAVQNVTVSPSQQTATLMLQAPTISAVQNVTVSPSQQIATLSLQAPTVSATRNVTVAPSQQTVTLTLFAPSVSAGGAVTVTPAQLTLTSTLQTPTVSAVRNVTIAPAQLTGTLSLQTPTVTTTWNVTVSPVQQVATLTLQTPSVSAGGAVTVTPSQLTLTASLLAPAISTVRHVTVTPTQLTTTVSLQSPTVSTVVPPPPNVPGTVTAGFVVVGDVDAGAVAHGGVTAGMVVVGDVVAGSTPHV